MSKTLLYSDLTQVLENAFIDVIAGFIPRNHPATLPLAEGDIRQATALMLDILTADIRQEITAQFSERLEEELLYLPGTPDNEYIAFQKHQLLSFIAYQPLSENTDETTHSR
ncbi:TPA: hypothetical protein JS291_000778 [Escherichia coli]|nr:hypothetical protein [Escherichia coli]MED9699954.1 hypothetical protein [Escherichia coli]HAY0215109.1 hypothetical protein [Escherichia coli]HEL7984745.1 hypothetical protein [Escherichia coli]HEM0050317.1 hypothetical protein [Escherichia coli]